MSWETYVLGLTGRRLCVVEFRPGTLLRGGTQQELADHHVGDGTADTCRNDTAIGRSLFALYFQPIKATRPSDHDYLRHIAVCKLLIRDKTPPWGSL